MILVWTLAAFVLPPAQAAAWKAIEPGLRLTFPADHGSHPAYRSEWWYVTGHLADEDGAHFGFQFTLFRSGIEPGEPRAGESPLRARQVYAAHLALTDVRAGETRFAERLRRASPLARAASHELDLALEGWTLARAPDDVLRLAADDPEKGFGFTLELRPTKPLVLHGESGISRKGADAANASAYSSWTRLAASGELRLDGGRLGVTGSAWFDHEFGSGFLEPGTEGWDWFALQLDDGRELMLFTLRNEGGEPTPASAATLVALDGSARALGRADFTLAAQSSWKSPRSGASYPARWTIAIPAEKLQLELVPLVPDCELASPGSTGVTYWEGPVDVRGSARGRGYAELTGYAGSMAGRF
jgi:predicted secreted hydrolase